MPAVYLKKKINTFPSCKMTGEKSEKPDTEEKKTASKKAGGAAAASGPRDAGVAQKGKPKVKKPRKGKPHCSLSWLEELADLLCMLERPCTKGNTQLPRPSLKGRKEGYCHRNCWRRIELWYLDGEASKIPRYYPTEYMPRKLLSYGKKPFSQCVRRLRSSITPRTVLMILTGRHRSRRVVFLKQLGSGLLLVIGPQQSSSEQNKCSYW